MSSSIHIGKALRTALHGAHLQPVTDGMGGALVYRVNSSSGERYLKVGRGRQSAKLRDEAKRTVALASAGIRVPEIEVFADGKRSTALLMSALPGDRANHSPLAPFEIVSAIARALSSLHGLPTSRIHFDETIAARLKRAKADIARGEIDGTHFEPRNRTIKPAALLKTLSHTRPEEIISVIHGDATLDNIIVAEDHSVGFIDCGRAGIGDRYTDLAVLCQDILERFGAATLAEFWKSYGGAENPEKSAYYADLYEFF